MIWRSKRPAVAAAIIIMAVITMLWSGSRFFSLFSGFSGLLEAELRHAACNGNTRKVKQLLRLGINVNATDGLGYSALIDAEACRRHYDLCDLPLRNGFRQSAHHPCFYNGL